MKIKLLAKLVLSSSIFISPALSLACAVANKDSIEVRRIAPITRSGEKADILQQNIVIGSVNAYLVPDSTSAVVRTVRKGMLDPLIVLSEQQVKDTRHRFKFSGEEVNANSQGSRKWIYVYANSYGKSDLLLSDPTGWVQEVQLGMVYSQPQPSGDPIRLNTEEINPPQSFNVDANRDSIWISVPGAVSDRWAMVEGADTSFVLTRVERLQVPYGDPAMVGLFFVGSRSPQSGVIRVESGEDPRKTFRFSVRARSSVAC